MKFNVTNLFPNGFRIWLEENLLTFLGDYSLILLVFILIIATFVQILVMVMKKIFSSLYNSLGIYLPLITTNCAVLGLATITSNYTFFHMLISSFTSGLGFLLVLYIFSSIRQKLDISPVPKSFKDLPIALITASILAMIIFRFSGV